MHTRLAFVLLALTAGCGGNPYFDDDEGAPQPDVPAVGDHPDHLSQPYVAGARIEMAVRNAQADWRLVSDTPSVFAPGKASFDKGTLSVDCAVGAAGQARLSAVDGGGAEQRAATIEVAAPDGAKVIAHGPARLLGSPGADPVDAEITDARVLTGGVGVVAIAWFQGVRRLYGRGVAQASAPGALFVERHTASGLPVNEFLFLAPSADGDYSVGIAAGGPALATLPVHAVPASDVAALTLEEEVGGSRNDGDQVWVLAQARDAAGARIYGAYSTWTLAGAPQLQGDMKTAGGDLFRYKYAPTALPTDLVATLGTLKQTLPVKAHSGQVYDTTYLGCSVAPSSARHSSRPALALLAAALVALALRSSRRR